MRAQDVRNLGVDELIAQAASLEAEYDQLLQSVSSGKEQNHSKLKAMKKDIARVKTVLIEKTTT